MKKKLITLLLSVCVLMGAAVPAFAAADMANFKTDVNTYENNFTDVPESEWYFSSVKLAYETGLMLGSAENFAPLGNLKIVEAIVMADRVHQIYHEGVSDLVAGGSPWYQPFIDYALANEIIKPGQYSDYEVNATRGDMAIIFANALPEEEFLRPINNKVKYIPDVNESEGELYTAVMKLYNAGITRGIDSIGTYMPENDIIRAEAAAIITRIAITSSRIEFVLEGQEPEIDNTKTVVYDEVLSFKTSKDTEEEVVDSTMAQYLDYENEIMMFVAKEHNNEYAGSDITLLTEEQVGYVWGNSLPQMGFVPQSTDTSLVYYGDLPVYISKMVINTGGAILEGGYGILAIDKNATLYTIMIFDEQNDAEVKNIVNSITFYGNSPEANVA